MLKIINPANEQTIRELESDTEESVRKKFNSARSAQINWSRLPYSERHQKILKFRGLLADKKEELSQVLTEEVGKPISQSRNELSGVLARVDYFLMQTEKVLSEEVVLSDSAGKLTEKITYEPLGVIANISAWNYPYNVGMNVIIPALLAGNSVLYKPSEFAALTGLKIAGLVKESGVPEDVFVPVIGEGNVGAAVLRQPISGIFFTGSYATGKKIAESVASRLIRTQFELGGKDPIYVCEDVSVESTVASVADGAFYNTGQSCCSVERIYVHEKIYDSFLDSFLKTVRGYVVGDPRNDQTYIGPLTRKAQLEVLERQCADALAKGAKCLTGGKRKLGKGYYFEPTVFSHVDHTMELMREESFGPIIGIQKVSGDEQAISLMNDTEYGLTAGIYTLDPVRAGKALSELNSGSVYWNCCDRVSPRLPWSGRGHSGLGSTLSQLGIFAFVQPKGWHLRG